LPKKTAEERFRDDYEADFEPEHVGEAAILDRVCALLDRIERLEAEIDDKGPTTADGKANPLLGEVRRYSEAPGRPVTWLNMEEETLQTQRARHAARTRWDRR
jgi:uncharacterized small protein (DUF1192 family)